MKKSLLAFTLTAAALTAPLVGAPTSASADDSIATATFTDGVLNINYPSKYAGRTVTAEDGNYNYGSVTLNSNGDATKDYKTGSSFRTVAPDRVYLNFEGFANPVARATNLVKEINGNRLMFKQNYNATEFFRVNTSDVVASGAFLDVQIKQTENIKRTVLYVNESYDETLMHTVADVEVAPSTQATLSGTAYPITAIGKAQQIQGDPGSEMTYELPFIFENKSYPAIVLR